MRRRFVLGPSFCLLCGESLDRRCFCEVAGGFAGAKSDSLPMVRVRAIDRAEAVACGQSLLFPLAACCAAAAVAVGRSAVVTAGEEAAVAVLLRAAPREGAIVVGVVRLVDSRTGVCCPSAQRRPRPRLLPVCQWHEYE